MKRAVITGTLLLAAGFGFVGADSALAGQAAEIPMGKMSEGDRGRITARAFADCLVKRKTLWVNHLLSVPNPESNRMIARADISECLGQGQLRFQPALLRGALFGAKYRAVYAAQGASPNMVANAEAFYSQDRVADPVYYSTLWIADCVVGKNADVVRRVVLAPPGTPEDNQAYQSLLPVLTGCVARGLTTRFSKATIDGYLAEALYRRTAASITPGPIKDR